MNTLSRYSAILAIAASIMATMLLPHVAWGNNIAVSSIALTGQNLTAGVNNAANFALVQFNLSWSNSWRFSTGPANWDAAWVFVKFRVGASDPTFSGVGSSGTTVTVSSTTNLRVGMPVRVTSGTGAFAANTVISSITNSTQFVVSATPSTPLSNASIECLRIWEHARLNNTGHTVPEAATVDAGLQTPSSGFDASTNPAVGVFIYRRAAGAGTNTYNNVRLRWNYGRNGVNDNAVVSLQVFAVEMVYVTGGVDFNVGGGGGGFTSTTINTGDATIAPTGTGSLGGAAGGYPSGQTAPTSDAWPNGYKAFYCMKYELAQGQYRDFLNTLTYRQQDTRTVNAPNSAAGTAALANASRNGIDIMTAGNATTQQPAVYACNLDADAVYNESVDGEWIACGYISWMDGCAYMDWAGLRPMTELEFEKACRGNQPAVASEYAWGTATLTNAGAGSITNSGASNEGTSTSGANICYGNVTGGPLRVGVFAGATTKRTTSGATYYGIMEMSGNLYERIVNINTATGKAYTGVHGDGTLSNAGNATTTAWPGLVSGEVTGVAGSGFKGGMWNSTTGTQIQVSNRQSVDSELTGRLTDYGYRGVRSAP